MLIDNRLFTKITKQREVEKKKYISFEKVILLVKIYNMPISKNLDYSKLAKGIEIYQTNTIFTSIIKILKEERIVKEIEVIGNSKIISVDKVRLKDFIGETFISRFVHDEIIKKMFNHTVFTEYNGGFKNQ